MNEIISIAVGAFLRFYQLSKLMPFSGDEGRDFLIVKDIIIRHHFPLLGPPTSLVGVHLGPFAYYLFVPALYLGKFHPASIAVLTVLFDLAAIFLLFKLSQTIFDTKTAFLASFLYATSPFAILQSRAPLHVSLTPFFSIFFILTFWQFIRKNKPVYLYSASFILGILLQLHLTAIIFVFAFFYLVVKRASFRQIFSSFTVFLFPLVPFFAADAKKNFLISTKLISWIPYRILSAFGIFTQKNLLTPVKMGNAINDIFTAFQHMIFVPNKIVAAGVFIGSLLILLKKDTQKAEGKRFIFFFLVLFLTSLFIHGQPAPHYFTLIAPFIIMTEALFLSKLKIWGIFAGLLIAGINIVSLLQANYFAGFSLEEEIKISKFIINDASGKKYQIFPPPDIVGLPEYYKNYQYLGWWLGNEPVSRDGEIKYTIYHRKQNIAALGENEELVEFPHSLVIKSR